jgi:hypothetical protein
MMKTLDSILDMLLEGFIQLASWGVMLIMVSCLFGICAVLGGLIFQSFIVGVLVGVVVVFGGGLLLFQLGKRK